jgi:DNA-binding NtrC family response regulator
MKFKGRLLHTGLEPSIIEALLPPAQPWLEETCQAATAVETLHRLQTGTYDVLLSGRSPAGPSIEQFVEDVLRSRPELPLLVVAQPPDYAEAVRLARMGIADYLPWESAGEGSLQPALESLARALDRARDGQPSGADGDGVPELVGRSEPIRSVARLIRLIAPRRATVLLTGRTGTGKELVARAIHAASSRSHRPLVSVNCGAIPENLIEAEFFGHIRGAFTGAVAHRVGRFEQADGGVIFLDEIGEMPLDLQSKLLRVLQEREFERVGSSETVKVDVRVIAATNCDLKQRVERGEFREDLYYRLNVVPIMLPSLAERQQDIPLLVQHLLERICRREDLPLKQPGPEAIRRLMEYSWPGNVRQLENAIDKAVVLSGERRLLYPSDFPLPPAPRTASADPGAEWKLPPQGLDFETVVAGMERSLLRQALDRTGGNKKRAADLLRIKRTTFSAKWRSLARPSEPRA